MKIGDIIEFKLGSTRFFTEGDRYKIVEELYKSGDVLFFLIKKIDDPKSAFSFSFGSLELQFRKVPKNVLRNEKINYLCS